MEVLTIEVASAHSLSAIYSSPQTTTTATTAKIIGGHFLWTVVVDQNDSCSISKMTM
jgi:hypothetical protein